MPIRHRLSVPAWYNFQASEPVQMVAKNIANDRSTGREVDFLTSFFLLMASYTPVWMRFFRTAVTIETSH